MGVIVVPGHTDTKLGNEGIREKPVVVYPGAVCVLDAGPFKIPLGWTARYSENGRLQNRRALVAEPGAQAVFVGEIGVYFGVNEVGVLMERQQGKEVVRVAGSCGIRHQREKFCGDGIDQRKRNDIRAAGSVGTGRIEG